MKTWLRISVAANCILTAAVVGLLSQLRGFSILSPSPKTARFPPQAAGDTPPPVRQIEQEPFRWGQLESPDYRTYVANLRRIGCPEQTIRDLITADVHAVYARQASGQKRVLRGAWEGQGADQDVLPEEAAVIETLLGRQAPPTPPVAYSEAALPRRSRLPVKAQNNTVLIPVAFASVDPDAVQLSEQQIEAVNEVRQRFRQELSETSLGASDPTYRQRWQTAQCNADEMLCALLGRPAYLQYLMQASPASDQPQGTQR